MQDETKSKIEKQLPLGLLRLDFQPPENLIEETVREYVDALKAGRQLSPVRVRFDGENYFLQDGFHRLEAVRRLGLKIIDAEISPGGLPQMQTEWDDYLVELKRSLAAKPDKK